MSPPTPPSCARGRLVHIGPLGAGRLRPTRPTRHPYSPAGSRLRGLWTSTAPFTGLLSRSFLEHSHQTLSRRKAGKMSQMRHCGGRNVTFNSGSCSRLSLRPINTERRSTTMLNHGPKPGTFPGTGGESSRRLSRDSRCSIAKSSRRNYSRSYAPAPHHLRPQ